MSKVFDENQIAGVSCLTLKKLLDNLSAPAFKLYWKYQYEAKRSKTNQPWANDSFMAIYFHCDRRTIQRWKEELIKNGLIKVIRDRSNATGQFGKSYTKVEGIVSQKKVKQALEPMRQICRMDKNHQCDISPHSGQMSHNCFKDNNSTASSMYKSTNTVSPLKEENSHEVLAPATPEENPKSVISLWNSFPELPKQHAHPKKLDAKLNSLTREGYKPEQILQAIKNYCKILTDDNYIFDHYWPLLKFLDKGLDSFIDLSMAKKQYRQWRKGVGRVVSL